MTIMKESFAVYCENTGRMHECKPGTTLLELMHELAPQMRYPVVAALVDNQLKELGYALYNACALRFLDMGHPDGRRTYCRTLSFVLQKAVADLFPHLQLVMEYNLPNGTYGEVRRDAQSREPYVFTQDEFAALEARMREIIAEDVVIRKTKVPAQEAADLFCKQGKPQKADLVKNLDRHFVSMYYIGDYADTFYGPLLYSTGALYYFELIPFSTGFCLQSPNYATPDQRVQEIYQDKLSDAFAESAEWYSILGADSIAQVNEIIRRGRAKELIQMMETLHERKYASIANQICAKRDRIKLVLISGPSSSGKTTTSKRIALQCRVLGLNPVVVAMDDYFVDREQTPLDENGEYDFESLYALDLPFLNQQLNQLFAGEEVEIPTFDFKQGRRTFQGHRIRMQEGDVLIMEGIHALNPNLLQEVEQDRIFRVYASALTPLSMDENNLISTSDNRMLRRMVRDNATRGVVPADTILRWPSVRRGEEKNIFPFQENADVFFNSSSVFELPLLRYYAEPLLMRIPPSSPAYAESVRLRKFLSMILPLTPQEIAYIPPTSILREFIGGSSFDY